MTTKRVRAQAAAMIRRLLEAVDRGDLDAPGGRGSRLLRRMEGAAGAWEAEDDKPLPDKDKNSGHGRQG